MVVAVYLRVYPAVPMERVMVVGIVISEAVGASPMGGARGNKCGHPTRFRISGARSIRIPDRFKQ